MPSASSGFHLRIRFMLVQETFHKRAGSFYFQAPVPGIFHASRYDPAGNALVTQWLGDKSVPEIQDGVLVIFVLFVFQHSILVFLKRHIKPFFLAIVADL